MDRSHTCRRRGAILIMVTLSLFVMFGMLGLVVDLGWAYFTKKSAQTAADAAALVAVKTVKNNASSFSDYNCGDNARCSAAPLLCADVSDGNLKAACDFAALNGFTDSREGRQTVTVQASDRTTSPTISDGCGQGGATVHHPPTTGCVDTYYWVTVRVSETIPQLFSAILGNREATASARATAAVAQSEVYGALILINRENERWIEQTGINLYVGGTPNVKVPGGILLASAAHGPDVPHDPWAGFISGSGIVDTLTGTTYFRAGGNYAISGGGQWLGAKSSSSAAFDDPMSGKGQPPLTESTLTAIPVPGGNLTATVCGGHECPSGNYYATGPAPNCNKNCATVATGEPITIGSDVTFRDGGFGDFHFFGGLKIGQATVTFGPGRYGLFGVKDPVRTPLWDNENRAQLLSTSSSDRGRLFILSDTNYDGLGKQLATIRETKVWGGAGDSLYFSKAAIKAGNNDSSKWSSMD
ncbi:MAG: hypothetical protein EHM35_16235 [Planctomycetaceae bacterium]|nr:MAG: hypothetical protein EHM35_16235 [Planctomycetaceae bacterium]